MHVMSDDWCEKVLISGCKDTQTSADANEDGVPTGALSWALLETLSKAPYSRDYSWC